MKHLKCCRKIKSESEISTPDNDPCLPSFDVQKRVLELFSEANITAYDLAMICNVPRSTVSRWLNSNCQMTLPSVERFCNALDISLSDFFSNSSLKKNERDDIQKLHMCWKHLSLEERNQVLDFINFIISKHKL